MVPHGNAFTQQRQRYWAGGHVELNEQDTAATGLWEVGGVYKLDLYFIYLFCRDVSAFDSAACMILSISSRRSAAASTYFKEVLSKAKLYIMSISAKKVLKISCELRCYSVTVTAIAMELKWTQ